MISGKIIHSQRIALEVFETARWLGDVPMTSAGAQIDNLTFAGVVIKQLTDGSIVIASEYHAKQYVLSFLPLDADVEVAFFLRRLNARLHNRSRKLKHIPSSHRYQREGSRYHGNGIDAEASPVEKKRREIRDPQWSRVSLTNCRQYRRARPRHYEPGRWS